MKQNVQTKNLVKPLRFALSIRALSKPHTDSVEATRDYMTARKKERNTINVNTKSPRPVFEERENPDTPPAITDHVRELASLIKNFNQLVRMPADPVDYMKRREPLYLSAIANNNVSGDKCKFLCVSKGYEDPELRPLYMFTHSYTEAGTANLDSNEKFHMLIDGKPCKLAISGYYMHEHARAIDNVNTNDKPAFRHDSLYLFDTLSEDYTA